MEDVSQEINKSQIALRILGFVALAAFVVLFASSFVVKENESAIVLRFGRSVSADITPGWHFKMPWPIDKVVRYDNRLQYNEIRLSETLTRDRRNVIVPMYLAWRISDSVKFLENVGDVESGIEKLDAIVTSARNSTLGNVDFHDLVNSAVSENSTVEAIEQTVLRRAQSDAQLALGIEVESVGVLQLNLPEANTESVFRRMRAERKQEAAQFRAEGKQKAEELRSQTDKETTILIAEAKRYAEEKRGLAEAEAARTYAQAHGADPDFYLFLRRLQSLRTVVDGNTTMILDTNAPPFDILRSKDPQPASFIQNLPTPKSPADESAVSALLESTDDTM